MESLRQTRIKARVVALEQAGFLVFADWPDWPAGDRLRLAARRGPLIRGECA